MAVCYTSTMKLGQLLEKLLMVLLVEWQTIIFDIMTWGLLFMHLPSKYRCNFVPKNLYRRPFCSNSILIHNKLDKKLALRPKNLKCIILRHFFQGFQSWRFGASKSCLFICLEITQNFKRPNIFDMTFG